MIMTTNGKGFGRKYAPDERDKGYPMRLLLDPFREFQEKYFPKGLPPGDRHYRPSGVLDQGFTGTCVGHGWVARLEGAPTMQRSPHSPFEMYRLFIGVDEWDDNDWEANAPDDQLQSGTSVRAGAKVCQDLGLLSNYLWAEEVEDVRACHLANFGGMVGGFNWTSDMMQTDSEGFISYTGTNEGGHCIATTGWNDRVRHNGRYVPALRFQNSWGREWGQGGRAWMTMDDVAKLLADFGEACLPVEVKVNPVKVIP
jgi:hypothetical protein